MNKQGVKGSDIINVLKKLAVNKSAVTDSNAGLMIGTYHKDVKKVLVTLEITMDVVKEAIANQADMIITYYPVLSNEGYHLRTDTPKGKLISLLMKHDIAVYCTYGGMDRVINEVNEVLCEKLKITNTDALKEVPGEKHYKLVTCIPVLPENYTSQIIERIGDLGLANGVSGAGVVGEYSHVCDHVKGVQKFIPMAKANPFIGTPGVMESVEVDRLEMIVPDSMIEEVLQHMIEIHPYEEVEYDLYELRGSKRVNGLGKIGDLAEDKSVYEVVQEVKNELGVSVVKVLGEHERKIRKVALCSGSSGWLIKDAYEKGADLFITGEVSYDEGRLARELGIAVIDASRRSTEMPILTLLKQSLESSFNENERIIEVIESKSLTETFKFI